MRNLDALRPEQGKGTGRLTSAAVGTKAGPVDVVPNVRAAAIVPYAMKRR